MLIEQLVRTQAVVTEKQKADKMNTVIPGVIFIVFGIIYIVYPNIFNRWVWKRTSIAQNIMSPATYKIYMRVLGTILVALGVYLVVNK